jgi:heat shock protein HslJ
MTELSGTWHIVGAGAQPLRGRPMLTFEGDGQVYGTGGVNRIRGTWSLDDDLLTLGPLASTLMAGPADAMATEREILEILGAPLRVEPVADGALVLRAPDGRSLTLEPRGPEPTLV